MLNWLHPDSVARAYTRALNTHIVKGWFADIDRLLFPALEAIISDLKLDALLDNILDKLKFTISAKNNITLRRLAIKYAGETSKFNAKQCLKVVKQLPIDKKIPGFDKAMSNFVSENVRLINGLSEETIRLLSQRIVSGIRKGYNAVQLQKSIQYRFGIDKGIFKTIKQRMELIAHDQIGKLNGQLTGLRQVALGIDEYVWETRMDDKVRPEHRRRQGKTFRWSEPPNDGHPGEAIRCRCWASPKVKKMPTMKRKVA